MNEFTRTLPVEDIIWLVSTEEDCEVEDSDGEETTQRSVVVADNRKIILAINYKSHEELSSISQVEQTLCDAMKQPLAGRPRRPMHVTFINEPQLPDAILSRLGVSNTANVAECGCSQPDESNMRICHKCHRRGERELFFACAECNTVGYCSTDCQRQDLVHQRDLHGHRVWCSKMKVYAQMSDQLAQFPFSYSSETTNENFGKPDLRKFLQHHGVLGQGLWQREVPQNCPKHMPNYGNIEIGPSPYVLPMDTSILCKAAKMGPDHLLEDWVDYCTWRVLSLDSPVPILLSIPLTVYHIIGLLYQLYPDRQKSDLSSLKIHIIGVEKEADMVPVFKELGILLPHLTINIWLIGPEISSHVCGRIVQIGNVTVTIQKGKYHRVYNDKPDLAIGLNAGLGAYMTWTATLQKLKDENIPAFFTDYCQYSCECSKESIEGLEIGTISEVLVNPFRSPVRQYCEDHTMPCYSNGFIFSLQYG